MFLGLSFNLIHENTCTWSCSNRLSYQPKSSTRTQSQLCTATLSMYGAHHWRILKNSYKKLVERDLTPRPLNSFRCYNWLSQLSLVQLPLFHLLFGVQISFGLFPTSHECSVLNWLSEVATVRWPEWDFSPRPLNFIQRFNRLSYQTMSSTHNQSQFCTATSTLYFFSKFWVK